MWSPNARDVGGLPTRYGVPTRARALLRSECIDADGLPAFEQVDAGLVLDLRSDWELRQPHPLGGDSVYQRIPWIDPAAEATRDPAAEPRLVDVYRNSLVRNAAHIGRIFTAIAAAPANQPVVVHYTSNYNSTMVAGLLPGPKATKAGTLTVAASPLSRAPVPGNVKVPTAASVTHK